MQSSVDKYLNRNSGVNSSSGSAVDAQLAKQQEQAKAKADLAKKLATAQSKVNDVVKDARKDDLGKTAEPKTGADKIQKALADAQKAQEVKQQPKEDELAKKKKENKKAEEKLAQKNHQKKTAKAKSDKPAASAQKFGDYAEAKNELEQLLDSVIAEDGAEATEGEDGITEFFNKKTKNAKKPLAKDQKTAELLRSKLGDLQASQGGKTKKITGQFEQLLSGNKSTAPSSSNAKNTTSPKGENLVFKNGHLYQKNANGKLIPADKSNKNAKAENAPKTLAAKTKQALKQKATGQDKTANTNRLDQAIKQSAERVVKGETLSTQVEAAKQAVQSGIASNIRKENEDRNNKLKEQNGGAGILKKKFERIMSLLHDEGITADSDQPLPASLEQSAQIYAAMATRTLDLLGKGANFMDPEVGPFQDITGKSFSDADAVAKRNKILQAKPGSEKVKSDQALNLFAGGDRKVEKHTGKLKPEEIQSDLDVDQPEGYKAGDVAQVRDGANQVM